MQITIPSHRIGGTLGQLATKYNTSVDELMRLNPQIKDKNKIQGGAILNVPELTSTLKTGEVGGTPTDLTGKTLPETPEDNLSIFKSLLRKVSEKYGQESMATGFKAVGETLGAGTSKISASNLGDIVDFIKKQTTPGVADIYKSTVDLLESSRTIAERQITALTSQNAWGQMNDEQVARLSNMSGWDFDYLMGIKKTQAEEAKKPKSFQTVEEGGRNVRLGFDEMGKIISRTDIGKIEGKTFEWKNLTPTVKGDVVEWLTKQEDYDLSWLKKLDEEPGFASFILSKYYQQKEEKW